MANTTAFITGGPYFFQFRLNPNSIQWSYKLNTSTTETYGGRVVQLLGTSIEGFTVTADCGRGGIGELRRVIEYCRQLLLWEKETDSFVTFNMPTQNLSFLCQLSSISFGDSLDNVSFPFTMNFNVQDSVSSILKSRLMTQELNRIRDGMGYRKSFWNDPETPQNIQAEKERQPNKPLATGGGSGGTSYTAPDGQSYSVPNVSGARKTLVSWALTRQGVPYVWGGNDPNNGMDCSGFTKLTYKQIGIDLPRTAAEQGHVGVSVPKEQAQPGDLVCYGSHVAIYLGNGQMIHEPKPGGHCEIRGVYGNPDYRRVIAESGGGS